MHLLCMWEKFSAANKLCSFYVDCFFISHLLMPFTECLPNWEMKPSQDFKFVVKFLIELLKKMK